MIINPISSNTNVILNQNERSNVTKVKEIMPEAEFTGLSTNWLIDSMGNRWTTNNDPYTKTYGKYDAYAYEWTVNTACSDSRSNYSLSHPTENM